MALHESALEELGLAPMWVRRGSGQGAAVEPAPESAADAVVSEAPVARADRDAAGSNETVRAQATGSIEAKSDAAMSGDIVEPAIKPVARAEAQGAHAPESRRAPPPASDAPPPSPDDDFAWFDDLPAEPPLHTSEMEAKADRPAQPAIDTLDWPALEARVSACERC